MHRWILIGGVWTSVGHGEGDRVMNPETMKEDIKNGDLPEEICFNTTDVDEMREVAEFALKLSKKKQK